MTTLPEGFPEPAPAPQDRRERPRLPAPPLTSVPWPAVVVFAVLACALAWLVTLPLWLSDAASAPPLPLIASAMMFTPTIAVLVVVFLMRTPQRGDRLRFLGVWPLRPVKRTLGMVGLSVLVPVIVVVAAVFLAGAFGLVELDLSLAGFAALNAQQAAAAGVDEAALPSPQVLIAIQTAALPLAIMVNSVVAFGEELGWRGWLVPALRPLGVWPALVVSGAIWGVWHAPLTLLGHNYGRFDLSGVVLMTTACVAWGVLFGWFRLRTGSLWPAVIGHASLNAVGAFPLFFVPVAGTIDLALAGAMGVVAWGVLAVVVVVLAAMGQFRRARLS